MFWEDSSWPLVVHYLLAIPIGMGVSVVFLIPWSLIPDIIDQDEHDNGFRREGVFYSLFVLFQKIGVAVGISATSYVLQAVGYVSSTDGDPLDIQPDSVILALRVMFGPVPIVLLVLSLVFAWFYPLDREMVEDIRERLAERRALLANKNDNKSQSSSVRNSLYGASSEDVVL
jgi:GPH family glycoside/pentoside/hexuronide:cation symporter